jgi:D-threonate/D-erythronate kinase
MIGVIADDLTGAAEIGAVGVRHGLRAEIIVAGLGFRRQAFRHRKPAKAGTPKADLVCVDTDSRAAAPEEAARRAAAAAKLLRQAGAKWIYKKVDSVLRGNVLAEIEAIMREMERRSPDRLAGKIRVHLGAGRKTGAPRVLLHPANPSLGRIIRNGKYFVGGKLIHKTEFARDPAHPRWTADVCALLNGSAANLIRVCKLRDPLPDEGVVICESTSPRDVQLWAERTNSATLLAGGAEFFAALLAARLGAPASRRRVSRRPILKLAGETPALPRERELFVCGSTSASSKKFISAARRAGTPIFSLPGKLASGADFTHAAAKAISEQVAAAFQSKPRVILQTGLRAIREAPVARKLSGHLTQLAEAVLKRARISHVYAEGGATAVELVRRMKWTRLKVLREVAPGVATLLVEGRKPMLLTSKPGSYVWPEEIWEPPGAARK